MTPTICLRQVSVNGAVPAHIAIIMDGNGRWARERDLPRPLGHRSGMKSVREVVEGAIEAGVEVLSLFAFSQENWQRPRAEIEALMSLLEEYIAREAAELATQGVRVRGARRPRAPHAGGAAAASTSHRARPRATTRCAQSVHLVRQPRRDRRAPRGCSPRSVRAGALDPEDIDEEAIAGGCTPRRGPIRIC